MSAVTNVQIGGLAGKGKTFAACTGRGRWAMMDQDNQGLIYAHPAVAARYPQLSPVALLTKPFAGMPAGHPAVWHTADPLDYTPGKLDEFIEAAGLGKGDTFIFDPLSEYFDSLMRAYDAKPGVKGAKVDWIQLKRPYKTTLVWGRNKPFDIVGIVRLGDEWEDGRPTGLLKEQGDKAKTPFEFPFKFWAEVDETVPDKPQYVLVCKKEKGGFFKVGEKLTVPLRDIFASRGVYEFFDALAEGMARTVDPETVSAQAGAVLYDQAPVEDDIFNGLCSRLRQATTAGKLAEFRKDSANRKEAAKLGPARLAEFKALVDELAKASAV